MNTSIPCDYPRLSEQLTGAGVLLSPAEIQGIAFGLVFGRVERAALELERQLLADAPAGAAQLQDGRTALGELLAGAEQQSDGDEVALQLCLPGGDEVSNRSTAVALRDWCRGFLFGIGLAGPDVNRALGAEGREVLADLVEISQLDADGVAAGEEDAVALAELQEYLRVATWVIRDDMRDWTRTTHESK